MKRHSILVKAKNAHEAVQSVGGEGMERSTARAEFERTIGQKPLVSG
jgi:hypothetical protein